MCGRYIADLAALYRRGRQIKMPAEFFKAVKNDYLGSNFVILLVFKTGSILIFV